MSKIITKKENLIKKFKNTNFDFSKYCDYCYLYFIKKINPNIDKKDFVDKIKNIHFINNNIQIYFNKKTKNENSELEYSIDKNNYASVDINKAYLNAMLNNKIAIGSPIKKIPTNDDKNNYIVIYNKVIYVGKAKVNNFTFLKPNDKCEKWFIKTADFSVFAKHLIKLEENAEYFNVKNDFVNFFPKSTNRINELGQTSFKTCIRAIIGNLNKINWHFSWGHITSICGKAMKECKEYLDKKYESDKKTLFMIRTDEVICLKKDVENIKNIIENNNFTSKVEYFNKATFSASHNNNFIIRYDKDKYKKALFKNINFVEPEQLHLQKSLSIEKVINLVNFEKIWKE